MRRRRYDYRASTREAHRLCEAPQQDLTKVEEHLVVALREVNGVLEVFHNSHGFRCDDADQAHELQRGIANLLFDIRAMQPALVTGDASGFGGGNGGSHA